MTSSNGGYIIGNGIPYPPININVHPSQFAATGLDNPATQTDTHRKILSSLDILGPEMKRSRNSEWQVINATDDTLKAAFRQVCVLILENGLDLRQVCQDQDPELLIGKALGRKR
ncbi:hypothetical protein N7520_001615 [Penicillium odoratum]|uniref:uncharacterized protein n=1 Tax=Penicillium odoratum TaxID=1167516 RepID=UPI002546D3A6|nr:uncharacterized protein N7520_001615 [Penicillium odoratum]KAJ5778369.1 hypothetical protein N7520_001615 [Penicillium odoratum]